jgi:hypothetical protein
MNPLARCQEGEYPNRMADYKAEIQQLLAQAIDAKCRLMENYQMFRCLELALEISRCSNEVREAVTRLIRSESEGAHDYLDSRGCIFGSETQNN